MTELGMNPDFSSLSSILITGKSLLLPVESGKNPLGAVSSPFGLEVPCVFQEV